MIKDKRRSLDHAVWFSYQGAKVIKTDATDRTPVRALIKLERSETIRGKVKPLSLSSARAQFKPPKNKTKASNMPKDDLIIYSFLLILNYYAVDI